MRKQIIAIPVAVETIHALFKNGDHNAYRVENGLPEDAKCVGSHFDITKNRVFLYFEHETFPVVPPGYGIPWQKPIITEIREN